MQFPTTPRVPVVAGVKLFWERVTFSRLTKIYFVFSVLHCIIQVVFQVQAFVANANAATFLYGLVQQGNATDPGFAVYNQELRMCDTVPRTVDSSSCTLVWDGRTKANVTFASNDQSYAAALSSIGSQSASSSSLSVATSSFVSSSSVATSSSVSSSSAVASSSAIVSGFANVTSSAGASSTSSALSTTASSTSSSAAASKHSTVTITRTLSSVTSSVTTLSASHNATRTLTVTVAASSPTPSATSQDNSAHVGDDEDDESDDDSDSDSDSDEDEDEDDDVEDEKQKETDILENALPKLISFSDKDGDGDSDAQPLHRRASGIDLKAMQTLLTLNGTARVNLNGLNGLGEVDLSRKCLYVLNWPVDNVENTKREDVAFIAFQVWLLGMSLVALLNESIPHVVASLLTHILATAWGGFQIYNTEDFHRKFTTLTTQGACGVNLLPDYWRTRSNAEIPSLALNCFALVVSAFLSWRLMKSFGWQTFKRVGASRVINRVYNLVLMLSISIQLALFFVGASAALWVDQVYNGNIGRLTMKPTFFKAVMIIVLVMLIPWLSTGWLSVRRELRIPMATFLGGAVLILAGWAAMFIAATFRWTYVTWLFFSLMTTAAVLLTVVVLVLGIVCRINFGKGLPRYLNAQEELPEDDYTTPGEKADSEKVAFPSNDLPIPTFSVAFGSGQEVPPPSQMRFAPRQMGPRFYSGSTDSNPFDTPIGSDGSASPPPLYRQNSRSSQHSQSSVQSAGSQRSKRWVIE
ncbi:hypothetical protein C2E23DRAFT_823292 [Lenzites betulinus]|nr:hypothetical protein C2E23DRAFT_823292 [Lenzites betulinus]